MIQAIVESVTLHAFLTFAIITVLTVGLILSKFFILFVYLSVRNNV